ncbi:helicase [Bacteroidota bacterium]|nr:helicase [Bacteroidota bacterium]
MEGIEEKIRELEKWLTLEKQEDLRQFQSYLLPLSLAEKRERGYLWYPLTILHQGFSIGENIKVSVERTKNKGKAHVFRAGNPIRLCEITDQKEGTYLVGVVHFVREDTMQIIFGQSFLPDWVFKSSIAILPEFDEKSYREMESVLKTLKNTNKGRIQHFKEILFGDKLPIFSLLKDEVLNPLLNNSQNDAINHIISSKDISIIHGPPGTGKTTTLVSAIARLCDIEYQVLVCAPSNTAVDLLTERISKKGINVVRLGNISRVDEDILNHTLDYQISAHEESKAIKRMRIEADALRKKANSFRTPLDYGQKRQKRELLSEASDLSTWVNQLEKRLIEQILDRAQVITCTLVGAAHSLLAGRKFTTVLIDEAAQALEPATWIPILKAERVVLCGDPFQLPPTVKSRDANKSGLALTLMEKAIQKGFVHQMLEVQYRGNELIMGYSNQYFYNNKLLASPTVKDKKLPFQDNSPVIFIDTAGTGFEEKPEPGSGSLYNADEFSLLREHIYRIINETQALVNFDFPSIVILSPYKGQINYMEREIREDDKLVNLAIKVKTIDGFQGQESDIVIVSLVRSNGKNDIGFLKDYRRFNVAITRAKCQVVVVGDSSTIGKDVFFAGFLDYCESNASYRTAWEYMA